MGTGAASRLEPKPPASQVLPAEVVAIVAAKAGLPAVQLTTQQCWYSIARLGGFLARKGEGPPGWKTLWHGWLQVQTLLEGVHLAARLFFWPLTIKVVANSQPLFLAPAIVH